MNIEIEKVFNKFKIKKFCVDYNKIFRKFIEIGAGHNGIVYLFNYKNKKLAIKKQQIFNDTPLFLINKDNCIISQTFVNEILINSLVSNINLDGCINVHIDKLYGYFIHNDNIFTIKKFYENTLENIIQNMTNNEINNLIIHILMHIHLIFEYKLLGYHQDLKLRNILVHKSNQNVSTYNFGNEIYNIKILNYIPIIIDFGSSEILKVKHKKLSLQKHMIYREKDLSKYVCHKIFDETKNLNNFMYTNKKILHNNEIFTEYFRINKRLTIIEFLNEYNIKKILQYNSSY